MRPKEEIKKELDNLEKLERRFALIVLFDYDLEKAFKAMLGNPGRYGYTKEELIK